MTQLKLHIDSDQLLELLQQLPRTELEQLKKLLDQELSTKVVKKPRKFGCMKGLVKYMAEDFNAPLEDFKDYM